ncbi:ATP-BINDING CASSETTE ABC TRANSPORTER-RELATED [Salix purpurea]|uniref:ATP-BINDING CASSETTE ABC TRANSPORTER-RELATED n=1 Tax=Salix purpurea TaxID=77065 RepID=A0A9Q0VAN8_SALPP|nr:ATP-BINDING CASSETTE ABC TRANSPORTER-RELATED [Salix purpurea]
MHKIPPRKSAASYRADEWDVNKWAWEGSLKVLSKGEECIIRLEDKITGELYALAFLRKGELLPVEPVIDSSR